MMATLMNLVARDSYDESYSPTMAALLIALVVLLIIRIVAHQQACNIFLLKLIARVTLSTLKSGSVAITLELDNCLLLATIGLFEWVFSSV